MLLNFSNDVVARKKITRRLIVLPLIFFSALNHLAWAQESVEEFEAGTVNPNWANQLNGLFEEMNVSDEERDAINRAMTFGREISRAAEKENGYPFRRDAHAKATGCVRATFSVNGDIPERLRYSVFSTPGETYRAWVRFSNGDMVVQKDSEGDARGMAVKLIGVEGEKIAEELDGPNTQDFIMTNKPNFFNRNIFDYVENMSYLAKLQRTKWFFNLIPFRLHLRELIIAGETVSSKIKTPFNAQYFSMLPYQLGGTDLKFSAKPCAGMTFNENVDESDFDFLTTAMQSKLDHEGACFDFMVQERVPGFDMPLDDATVVWQENDSPFVAIARINIPAQKFIGEAQAQFCENLSMNPWHGVGEWTPKGSLSRARRFVYAAVSQFRHGKNDAQVFEPSGWCLDGTDNCSLEDTFVRTHPEWPLPRIFDKLYSPVDERGKLKETDTYYH